MGQIKWYKRDPSAALNGMMELSLEERGAYNTVLDLIYSRDGKLVDDDRFIAGWLRVDMRVWRRIKTTLIDRGKLFIADGHLRNERADVEILAALSRVASAQDAGLASARSKAAKSERQSPENNDLGSTTVPTDVSTTVSTNYNHNQKGEEEGKPSPSPDAGASASAKAGRAKGVRKQGDDFPLPEDWKPNLGEKAQQIVDGWPPGKLDREELAFRSHAQANGRVAKNWDAAFRTWIVRSEEQRIGNGNRNGQANGGFASGDRGPPDRRDGFTRAIDRLGGFDQPGGFAEKAG